jgi:hypothetical protein
MVAKGITYTKYFDMSKYTREEIYQRYTPFLKSVVEEDDFDYMGRSERKINVKKKIVQAPDMTIVSYDTEPGSDASKSIWTCGKIMEEAAPKLCRIDLIDTGLILFSYPRFPGDPGLTEKIESGVQELARTSMTVLRMATGMDDWKESLKDHVKICYSFMDSPDDTETTIERQIVVTPSESIDWKEDNRNSKPGNNDKKD